MSFSAARIRDAIEDVVAALILRAADDGDGDAVELAVHELGGSGQLVDDGHLRDAQLVARGVVLARVVDERRDAGDTDGEVEVPFAPRPAEGVRDDDGDIGSRGGVHAGADRARRGIGVDREQAQRARLLDVRRIDAGVGADETVPRLADHHAVLHTDDALGLD